MIERFNNAKRKILEKEFDFLNPEQREAVFASQNGKALILRAGAGTGKTTTVVNKIAYLIKYGDAYSDFERLPYGCTEEDITMLEDVANSEKKLDSFAEPERIVSLISNNPVAPYRILAVTFTNKAANEMRERVEALVGMSAADMWIGTFHSICVKILHRYISYLDGYDSGFTIFDTDDAKTLLKACIRELGLNDKEFTPSYLLNIISDCKNKMMSPEDFAKEASGNFKQVKIAEAYMLYQKKLKANNALDFDDIINHTVKILQDYPEVAEKLGNRFKHVIVDEFQDTNDAQYEFVDIISNSGTTLCAVGDDDQSIYGWRGANIEHILQLSKTAQCLTINRNYRSSPNIIGIANEIIAHNKNRFDKQLRAVKAEGDKVVYSCVESDLAEGYFVSDTIAAIASEENRKYSDFTVLYRTNAQSRIFEESLMRAGIPYKIVGSLKFYDRQEVKDMLAYLRVLINPNDSVSFRRIINFPKRGIGDTTVNAIENLSVQTGKTPLEIIRGCENYESIKRARSGLTAFCELMDDIAEFASENPVSDLISHISSAAGFASEYIKEGEAVCETRMDNIAELVNMASGLENENEDEPYTLADFLERMALVSGIDEMQEDSSVTLMTVHTAKGLEFPVVFVVGLEEGLFPSIRNYVEDEKEIEEERRLCYVAVTRAKEKLFLTCANRRLTYGKTTFNPVSRFIKEIPMNMIEDRSTYRASSDMHKDSEIEYYERRSGVSYESFVKTHSGGFAGSKPSVAPKSVGEIKSFIQKERHTGQSFAEGDRVNHKKFGNGVVKNIASSGDMTVLTVDFDGFGRKNIIASVVTKI